MRNSSIFHPNIPPVLLSPALYINLIRIPKQRYSNTDIIRDDEANYLNTVTSIEETKSHFTERFKVYESANYLHTEFMYVQIQTDLSVKKLISYRQPVLQLGFISGRVLLRKLQQIKTDRLKVA